MTIEERAFAVTASDECEKLMTRFGYLYSCGMHREIFERLFSKREDITLTVNNGQYNNRYSVFQAFVLDQEQDSLDRFLAIKERYPEIADRNVDMRRLRMYRKPLMHNMVFELAADQRSAKGIFYTTAYVYNTATPSGVKDCRWIMERHAADFIYEDDEWKILNFRVNSDAEGLMDTYQWSLQNRVVPEFDEREDYDLVGTYHKAYSPVQVPQNTPAIPEAYDTYTAENSYAVL
jgi:hypothetical protein